MSKEPQWFKNFRENLDERLNKMENRLDNIESRLDNIEKRIDNLVVKNNLDE